MDSIDEQGFGLGHVIMDLWRMETGKNKSILHELIERWCRPLFGASADYRQLKAVESERSEKIMQRTEQLAKQSRESDVLWS
jgi:hypothetical protein